MARATGSERPDPRSAWSTPLDAPLYPRYPIPFRDIEFLTLQYRTDPEAIRRLVPEPLEPTGDTVLLHVARMGDVPGIGAGIHECNVMVGVRLATADGAISASYSPYFFLDSDRAIAQGREVQGQPKRAAIVDLEVRGDLVVGTVVANGIDILTGTLPYKQRRASLDELRARVDMITNINLKIVPNMDGTIALRQLVARDLENVRVLECWSGPGTVELRPNAAAPLYRLPVMELLDGYHWRAEFDLVGGRVLHDYLGQGSQASRPRSTKRGSNRR
jgi:Acetoacetate decarboxylase